MHMHVDEHPKGPLEIPVKIILEDPESTNEDGSVRKLDVKPRQRILEALERFAATGIGDVKRLQGLDPPEWRLRVGR